MWASLNALAAENPISLLFVSSLICALVLYRLNQMLQRSYDLKAD